VTVNLAVASASLYAHHQPRLYRASATVLAHPSGLVSRAVDYNSDLGMLTYGTLAETFSSLAESRTLLGEAGRDVGLTLATLRAYSATATSLPGLAVVQVAVQGPDPVLAARLANRLVRRVGLATATYFHVIALTPLDDAAIPSAPIRPRPAQDALYGGLAGLIAGYLAAALSLRLPASVPTSTPTLPMREAGVVPVKIDDPERVRVKAHSDGAHVS
jgi:capsular polysaccharide biosynthesis protein